MFIQEWIEKEWGKTIWRSANLKEDIRGIAATIQQVLHSGCLGSRPWALHLFRPYIYGLRSVERPSLLSSSAVETS